MRTAAPTTDVEARFVTGWSAGLLRVVVDHPAEHHRRLRDRVTRKIAVHASAGRAVDDDGAARIARPLTRDRRRVGSHRIPAGRLAPAVARQTVAIEDRLDVLRVGERLHAD